MSDAISGRVSKRFPQSIRSIKCVINLLILKLLLGSFQGGFLSTPHWDPAHKERVYYASSIIYLDRRNNGLINGHASGEIIAVI